MSLSPRGDRSPIASPETSLVCVGPPVVFGLPALAVQIDAITPSGSGGLFLEYAVSFQSCKGTETKRIFYSQISIIGEEIAPLTLSDHHLSETFVHATGRQWHKMSSYEAACEILAQQLAMADEDRRFITLTIIDPQASTRFVDLLRKQPGKCMIVLRNPIPRRGPELAASPSPLFFK